MGFRDAVFAWLPASFSVRQITAHKSCPALIAFPQTPYPELTCPIKICYYVYYNKYHTPKAFVGAISSNCLTLKLPEVMIQLRAK